MNSISELAIERAGDLEETTLIVCMRVSKMARPVDGAVQRQCYNCQCGIWVSPTSIRQIPELAGIVKLQCCDCAIPVIIREKAELIQPTAEQIEEVKNELVRRTK